MVSRVFRTIGLNVCAGLLLAGCASGNVASRLTTEETVGSWVADDDFGTKLVLNDAGTLEATDWPESLGCNGPGSVDIAHLRESARRDLSGTWRSYGEPLTYQLSLFFDTDKCQRGGVFAWVWRKNNGSLVLCAIVPENVSMEDLVTDDMFRLYREPTAGDAGSESCL